jgi:hypothetical protein
VVVPWSVFWERNLFVDRVPHLEGILLNHFVRGAISGVGLICLGASLAELATVWKGRTIGRDTARTTREADDGVG